MTVSDVQRDGDCEAQDLAYQAVFQVPEVFDPHPTAVEPLDQLADGMLDPSPQSQQEGRPAAA